MTEVQEITSDASFREQLAALPPSSLVVLSFHTPWAAPCAQMSSVVSALAASYPRTSPPSVYFFSVDAEELPDISEDYDVSAVPFLVLLRNGEVVETVSGSDATKVRDAVERHAGKSGTTTTTTTTTKTTLPPPQKVNPINSNGETSSRDLSAHIPSDNNPTTAPTSATATADHDLGAEDSLHTRLTKLVSAAPVMLFMKGTPSSPQCGFSRQLVALLRSNGVRYGFFNILADDEVRQGLKTFADWPTFPQLWVEGELIGGLDIVKEEFENNPEFLKDYAAKFNGAPAAPAATGTILTGSA